jgi:putative redox protein
VAAGQTVPITVTHVSGVKFAIQIRTHQIIVDQTVNGGGADSAPTPVELLGASLGSCIAYYMHRFFHARGLPADDITVSVVQISAPNPNRVECFEVAVRLPADVPDEYMPLLHRVIDACPAHNTLAPGARIYVTFESPARQLSRV